MKTLSKIFLLVVIVTSNVFADSPVFIELEKGVYEKARIKAAQEGKLLFMDFYAKWCTPCKWMDETTFADPEILKQLDEKYIAIKIDIDEMEGFELKSRFDIRYLPTMLIFNSEGKMVERIEETLSPSKMSNVLGSHSTSKPNSVIKHEFNMSPQDAIAPESQDEMILSQDEYRKYFAQTESVYRMQMGVFENYDGAVKKVNGLREVFMEEISIVEDYRGDKKLYKVIMGEFNSLSSAESYRKILKDKHQLESILY